MRGLALLILIALLVGGCEKNIKDVRANDVEHVLASSR
ncbi:MAG: hypothetical protein JWN40_1057 [Phycisphaerales bacterium]|nr:hypothetical protein [Phycisphaerales bacterium]